jgi:hypothetical protein
MTTTIWTKWGCDIIAVSADWAQASCAVIGDSHGRQVADFRHSPKAALRAALEDCASAEGMDDDEASDAIDAAMSGATHADSYVSRYHERD